MEPCKWEYVGVALKWLFSFLRSQGQRVALGGQQSTSRVEFLRGLSSLSVNGWQA